MTLQEALWFFKEELKAGKCSDDCLQCNSMEMAIEALEKQISKKPYLDNDNGVYEKEHCPTCHRSLFPNDHHCRCGQAIDWSVEDDK